MDEGTRPRPGIRHFVVLSHTVPADGAFSLNDLPGSGGRVDVIARCVSSALLTSNSIRRDASVTVCILSARRPVSVTVHGSSVRYLNPDERSTAALIKNALVKAAGLESGISSPGIYFNHKGLSEVIEEAAGGRHCYSLSETGERVDRLDTPSLVVLGDQIGMTAEEVSLLGRYGGREASLSKFVLQTDQCITISNWMMDMAE